MAICFVVFNPAQTKRILMNYFYAKSRFELQGLPIFTLELLYEGRSPEIPGAYHVTTNSYLFHKENLFKVLVKTIPHIYQKIAFLDADVYFEDPSWYEQVSLLLDSYDVVQPFEIAHRLDLSYSKKIKTQKSFVLIETKKSMVDFHPGFAWCMRREWYEQNGFFEFALSGSSDLLSAAVWHQLEVPREFPALPKGVELAFEEYKSNCRLPKITFGKGISIYHLYHGSFRNRQYLERHKLLQNVTDIRELITRNQQGVFEWKEPEIWNPLFLTYFRERNDDDV